METRTRAEQIRMLVLDVDGVLTDGGLYYSQDGTIGKRFHVQDGLGIKLAQAAELEIAVATGLDAGAVHTRVRELGITEYSFGRTNKVPFVEDILERRGWQWANVAFLGDDWVDAAVMNRVGLKMAVANAQPEIIALADWVSSVPGGQGAVREAIRFLLTAQGRWEALWRQWAG
ncbi:KdsC family phosphatase [Desulfohalobium retbaense]|uniref:3-deoxy-D-manno-octulosonate 8-phosphate phosphatase KdsC n=1 Tax=Desulfohalobium retbaense (strain ATCC 49708 / DSM 5692 / JCM 16813 / HR100) TaxID=485915 RepID=C8X392_DESRD|nr:HAD hydrolase family protein [Desulfohalobium retbaense]ACV68889.1 3-deoxy-D-manno-octulosonate 8-phosphate phosphatase, YrbI family [Desulfohalobium retbaense DSM 5692]